MGGLPIFAALSYFFLSFSGDLIMDDDAGGSPMVADGCATQVPDLGLQEGLSP